MSVKREHLARWKPRASIAPRPSPKPSSASAISKPGAFWPVANAAMRQSAPRWANTRRHRPETLVTRLSGRAWHDCGDVDVQLKSSSARFLQGAGRLSTKCTQYNDPDLALIMENCFTPTSACDLPPQRSILRWPTGSRQSRRNGEHNLNATLPYVRAGATLVSGDTASFAFRSHYADYVGGPTVTEVASATRDLGEFLYEWRAAHPDTAPAASTIWCLIITCRATSTLRRWRTRSLIS